MNISGLLPPNISNDIKPNNNAKLIASYLLSRCCILRDIVASYVTYSLLLLYRKNRVSSRENRKQVHSGFTPRDAVSAVNKMWASGIINGFEDGTVRPKETASRAQVAQLIYKVMLIQYAI